MKSVNPRRPRLISPCTGLTLVFLALCSRDAQGASVSLEKESAGSSIHSPLEKVTVSCADKAVLVVSDGKGREYVRMPLKGGKADFTVRGSLGFHRIVLFGRKQGVVADTAISVDAATGLTTRSGWYDPYFQRMKIESGRRNLNRIIDGKAINYSVGWIRDNYYVLKATKLWRRDVVRYPQLHLDYQKPNGMIFDKLAHEFVVDPYSGERRVASLRLINWGEEYVGISRDTSVLFERIPVEADVEYLTVAHVYTSWQASGDDAWMAAALPKLEKAMTYSMTHPLRWSKEHGLVKRGYTIDTWDFQHPGVRSLHPSGGVNKSGVWDHMWIDRQTPMGVMHGDNSGMYMACDMLARMCRYLGKAKQEKMWRERARSFQTNTRRVCWNGTFYTHFIPIDSFPEEMGAQRTDLLSFSNAHAINRGLADHSQAVSIIGEYLRRRETTKERSFAEWFAMDPSPAKHWGSEAGSYMNGGITSIVAGELAKAALNHGYESYGVDILKRLAALHDKHGRLHAVYHPTSRQPHWKEERFTPVDLSKVVNRHFRNDRKDGWLGREGNDLRGFPTGRQTFAGKVFDITDPESNKGHAALVIDGVDSEFPTEAVVPVPNQKAGSVYFLHAAGSPPRWPNHLADYRVEYSDGSSEIIKIVDGQNIKNWWQGQDRWRRGEWRVVWRGKNQMSTNIAMGIYGWNNPHPGKKIRKISLAGRTTSTLMVVGVTLSSAPVQYERGDISSGIPDNWGVAAVFSAAIEGLVGVVDNLKCFEVCTVAPRWVALGETGARATVRYGASQGYVAYDYAIDKTGRQITMDIAGSGRQFDFHVLLPVNTAARSVTLNGAPVDFTMTRVEKSPYVDFVVDRCGGGRVAIALQ